MFFLFFVTMPQPNPFNPKPDGVSLLDENTGGKRERRSPNNNRKDKRLLDTLAAYLSGPFQISSFVSAAHRDSLRLSRGSIYFVECEKKTSPSFRPPRQRCLATVAVKIDLSYVDWSVCNNRLSYFERWKYWADCSPPRWTHGEHSTFLYPITQT